MEKWICKTTGLECIKCNIGCDSRKIVNKRNMTNYECIKLMTKEELSNFLLKLLDENKAADIGCFNCINYGTHHYEDRTAGCEDCDNYYIGEDVMKWLESEVVM